MTSYALSKMEPMALRKYLDDQMDLFKSLGHNPSLAFSHQLEKGKDGYWHLTRRDKSIEIIDHDLDGQGVRIALHSKMKHANFFGDRPKEEDRLMFQDICTVEVGELQGGEME